MIAPDPADLPLFKPQHKALQRLCALLARYDGCTLALPEPRPRRTTSQCELRLECAARGTTLRATLTLRQAAGYGWAPTRAGDWTGVQARFDWECSPAGRARWIGAAPAVALDTVVFPRQPGGFPMKPNSAAVLAAEGAARLVQVRRDQFLKEVSVLAEERGVSPPTDPAVLQATQRVFYQDPLWRSWRVWSVALGAAGALLALPEVQQALGPWYSVAAAIVSAALALVSKVNDVRPVA